MRGLVGPAGGERGFWVEAGLEDVAPTRRSILCLEMSRLCLRMHSRRISVTPGRTFSLNCVTEPLFPHAKYKRNTLQCMDAEQDITEEVKVGEEEEPVVVESHQPVGGLLNLQQHAGHMHYTCSATMKPHYASKDNGCSLILTRHKHISIVGECSMRGGRVEEQAAETHH